MRRNPLAPLAVVLAVLVPALAVPAAADTAPPPPDAVWVAATARTSITVAWQKVPGATQYRVALSPSATMDPAGVRTVSGSVATFTGLQPGTTYYARIRASDGTTLSEPSRTSVSARTTAVAKPLTAVRQDEDFVDVRWAPYAGADRYQVQSSTTADFGRTVVSRVVTGRTTVFGVERDSTAYFRVRALTVTSTGGIRALSHWSPPAAAVVPYHPV